MSVLLIFSLLVAHAGPDLRISGRHIARVSDRKVAEVEPQNLALGANTTGPPVRAEETL